MLLVSHISMGHALAVQAWYPILSCLTKQLCLLHPFLRALLLQPTCDNCLLAWACYKTGPNELLLMNILLLLIKVMPFKGREILDNWWWLFINFFLGLWGKFEYWALPAKSELVIILPSWYQDRKCWLSEHQTSNSYTQLGWLPYVLQQKISLYTVTLSLSLSLSLSP